MPCCLLDRNTIIEHTSALWPTGECLTLAQFCPDQGSDTGKWWRKYFLCQGDLGTLFSTLSPLKANGGEKKEKPNPEKSSVDFLGVRPYCSPSLCPAHPTLLCLAQTRPGRAPCACAVRVRHAKQAQQHSDQSLFSCSCFLLKTALGSKVCPGSLC